MNSQDFAKDIQWDLSDLYDSIHSPRIDADLDAAARRAEQFRISYKPLLDRLAGLPQGEKIAAAAAFPLEDLMRDFKEITELVTRPAVFAHLSFAVHTNEAEYGAFLQKVQTASSDIQTQLVFFEVSWNKLDDETVRIIMDRPGLAQDRHFLKKLRVFAPYTLSEPEEKILTLKSNTSGRAFSRLFDEIINNIPFTIESNGSEVRRTKSEILALLHSSDREERRRSSVSLARGLKSNAHILTYIYNMILADHRTSLKLRKYGHPMDPMNLSNEITLDSVMGLIQAVKAGYPVAARFYELKRRLLGLDNLFDYDRYAPVARDEQRVDFSKCRDIVLEGYYAFCEEAGKIAELFFEKRWIDAQVREGKHGGGFCAQTTPDLHPYILVNYTGTLRDVMTVAHEIGHGIHQVLASRRAGILESDAPLTMAETASVFGEMLIFERLYRSQSDPKRKLALLCGKIDDHFATVFRQIVLTNFEQLAHTKGLVSGELSSEMLCDLWIKANEELYGDCVELTEEFRYGWKYIPHFIHSPFYCYAYAFAQLFVLTLFQKYKEDPAAFAPAYLEMLSLGGSRSPDQLASLFGININAADFWSSGLNLLSGLVDQAEALAPTQA